MIGAACVGGRAALLQLRFAAVTSVIFCLVACGTPERPAKASSASARPPVTHVRSTVSEAGFVAENASMELFVIRSSELALQRSSSPRVREFAQRMIDDHKGTSAQLSLEGRRMNLLPSATLATGEEAMLEGLQTSSHFDADYVRDERSVHQRLVALDTAYVANGGSPTLKPVASAALPIEQRHLRLIAYV